MSGCTDGQMDEWINGYIDGRVGGRIHLKEDKWIETLLVL